MIKSKSFEELTEGDFIAYEKIRKRGKHNMLTEATEAALAAGLDKDVYLGVLKHYGELMDKFPHVRKGS